MKYLLLGIFILLTQYAWTQVESDSIDLRVYNVSKHKIIEIVVTVNNKEYRYSEIEKWQHSEYKKMPYIYSSGNLIEITLEQKRFLRKKNIVTIKQYPIDHIGDEKYSKAKCVMEIKGKITKKHSTINQEIILETAN